MEIYAEDIDGIERRLLKNFKFRKFIILIDSVPNGSLFDC